MTESLLIQRGDIVNVYFENISALFNLKVIDLPRAVGDCWKLEDEKGKPINIMNFCVMEKCDD